MTTEKGNVLEDAKEFVSQQDEIPATRRASGVRGVLLVLHRGLGIFLGLYFVLMGLTGSLLMFATEIDTRFNPQLLTVTPQKQQLPLSRIVAAVRREHPDAALRSVRVPRKADGVYEFRLGHSPLELKQVFVNPYTAHVLGERRRAGTLLGFTYYLHSTLMLGQTGEQISGYAALLLGVLLLSGLVLWWPSRLRQWPQRLVLWRRKRGQWRSDIHTLHNACGVYSLPLLLLLALTGSLLLLRVVMMPVAHRLAGTSPPPPPPKVAWLKRPMRSVDELTRIADATVPGTRAFLIILPSRDGEAFGMRKEFPEGLRAGHNILIWVHPYTGAVLQVYNSRREPLTTRLVELAYALHLGIWGGFWGKMLYVIAGLIPTVLFVTGLFKWRRRRQKIEIQQGDTKWQKATRRLSS